MGSSPGDDLNWSEETYTLKQVINDVGLPTVVRVSEGIYSRNESETFSNGDLLKLDFEKTIIKVSARFIRPKYDDDGQRIKEDAYGYLNWKDDILIPLGYKGKLQVVRADSGYKKYRSVKELVKDFPRFVRVDKPVNAKDTKKRNITIPSGSRLELDRELPDKDDHGLVCIYNGDKVVLNHDSNGSFALLPDETFYTLQEVVDKLPLPQCIVFIDTEFNKVMTTDLNEALENISQFSGPLQLQRTVSQKVVVGHHKPSDQYTGASKYCKRSLVILPLDSENINGIMFQVPLYMESDEYELLMVRHFSDTGVTDIDGGLYLEFAKNPKVHLIRGVHKILGSSVSQSDKPPPVPPRSYRCGTVSSDKKQELTLYRRKPPPIPDDESSLYEIEEEDTSPTVTRRNQYGHFDASKSPNEQSRIKDEESETDYPDIALAFAETSAVGKHLSSVPKMFREGMKKVQKELQKLVRNKTFRDNGKKETTKDKTPTTPKSHLEHFKFPATPPKTKETKGVGYSDNQTSPEDDSEDNLPPEYDYPDLAELKISKPSKNKQETNKGPKFISTVSGNTSVCDGSAATKIPSSGQATKKPFAKVQPQERREPEINNPSVPTQTSYFDFATLSVTQVVERLRNCGLSKMADICYQKMLDGSFLDKIEDDDLTSEFRLKGIDLIKFKKLKSGWTPRQN